MRHLAWVALVGVGCGGGSSVAVDAEDAGPSQVSVRVLLDGAPRAGGGDLVVQVDYDDAGRIEVEEPRSEGLTFTLNGAPRLEDLGDRDVVTQRYVYEGSKGNYEVLPLTVRWVASGEEPVEVQSSPVFLDLEADPLSAGDLSDIDDPSAIWRIPWIPILTVSGVFLVGLGIAFWPRTPVAEAEAVPLAPHEIALQRWESVRYDPSLTDEDKARELSVIFRAYTEAVLGFEASAWTTSEILAKLRTMSLLPEGNVPRAKRMLRATDRIKFAEERPTDELIEELDADLRAYVTDTRPAVWGNS